MSLAADLELLTEDMPLDYNPTDYNDPAVPAPPATGNYQIKLGRYGLKKNKEGGLVKWGGYNVLTISSIEITEPIDDARKVRLGRWGQDFGGQPFMRDGKKASNLEDMIRAHQQTARAFSGEKEGLALLNELVEAGHEPKVKLDWIARDDEFINEQLAVLGIAGLKTADLTEEQRELRKALYKKGEIKSMFSFPKVNGKFSPIWGGVDGNKQIEATAYIVRFYPSLEPVKLGPQR